MDPFILSIIASFGAALCLTLTIIFDRYIVNDYYDGNIKHAWLVSSLWGGTLGFTTTLIILSFFILFTSASFSDISSILSTLNPFLILGMIFAGFVASHMIKHYFALFTDTADSSLIAAWLSSSPVLIIGVYAVLSLLVPDFFIHHSLSFEWIIGIITASLGLFLFQFTSRTGEGGGDVYYKHIFSYISYSIVYTIIIHEILVYVGETDLSLLTPLILLFFYWIGFGSAGAIQLLYREDRLSFKIAWKQKIHIFWAQILLIEIINMFVFYFEYLGLIKLDPAIVSVIIGTCIFCTYIIDLLLTHTRYALEQKESSEIRILSFTLRTELLPTLSTSAVHVFLRIFIILITVGGIYLAT